MTRPRRVGTAACALLASMALASCGAEVPSGGAKVATTDRSPVSRRVDPEELFPADLDLSVRIDLGRLRGNLVGTSRELLGSELGADPLLAKALPRARVVTVAMRVSNLEVGDRVVALEGDMKGLEIDSLSFRETKTANNRVHVYLRRDEVTRDDFGAVVVLDQRALVFVSPVEIDSVLRVLGRGPDERRPDPSADGVVTVDYRPHRLSRSLEKKFPAVGRIIAELESVKGNLDVGDKGVVVDATFMARSEGGAGHVRRFIEVLRDNTVDTGLSAALRNIEVDAASTTLHVKWVLPPEVVLGALARRHEASETPANGSPSATPPTPPAAPSNTTPSTPKRDVPPSAPPASTDGLRLSPPPPLDPPRTGH